MISSLPVTIDGIAYASGITFGVAPANGTAVLISYTRMAGMRSLIGALAKYVPVAIALDVDSAGVATFNGGWQKLSDAPIFGPDSPSASTATILTDSGQAWTVDEYRGYVVLIVTDTTTPAAVGQTRCIQYNTATALALTNAWAVTPSTAATYVILKSYTEDGIHPSSFGAMALAGAADDSLALVA